MRAKTGVANFRGVPGLMRDVIANRPVSAFTGTWFLATDEKKLYEYIAGAWVLVLDGSGGAGLTGAINGLDVDGANAILGGILDRLTFINRNGNRFSIANDNGSGEDSGQLVVGDFGVLLGLLDALTGMGTHIIISDGVYVINLPNTTNSTFILTLTGAGGSTRMQVTDPVLGVSVPFIDCEPARTQFTNLKAAVGNVLLQADTDGVITPTTVDPSIILQGDKFSFSAVGDGVATTFHVAHFLSATFRPVLTPLSAAAAAAHYVTNKTVIGFDIEFLVAPANLDAIDFDVVIVNG